MLHCIDNTVLPHNSFPAVLCFRRLTFQGAAMVECIKVLNGSKQAYLGDRIVCVVQRIRTQTAQEQARKQNATVLPKLNRGDVRRAVVVRTKQQVQRKDGSIIRFDDNACILIDDKGEPLGTRIMGSYLALSFLGGRC
jgi:large subunit ribosomal protein L14